MLHNTSTAPEQDALLVAAWVHTMLDQVSQVQGDPKAATPTSRVRADQAFLVYGLAFTELARQVGLEPGRSDLGQR